MFRYWVSYVIDLDAERKRIKDVVYSVKERRELLALLDEIERVDATAIANRVNRWRKTNRKHYLNFVDEDVYDFIQNLGGTMSREIMVQQLFNPRPKKST